MVARADSIDSISKGLDAGGDQNRNSKFLNYFRGQQVPWRSLVDLADKVVPGSSWELRQVIWSALRMDISAREHAHAWMQQLVAPIQVVVMTHNNEIRLDSGRHLLPSLERRASFDALAALTILIRLAHEQGNREFVWQCAHSIMRVLLMIGMELFEYKIATRLFNLYVERIFPLASKRGMALSVKDFPYLRNALFLHMRQKNCGKKQAAIETGEYPVTMRWKSCGSVGKKKRSPAWNLNWARRRK